MVRMESIQWWDEEEDSIEVYSHPPLPRIVSYHLPWMTSIVYSHLQT